jgi:hypothetical protein
METPGRSGSTVYPIGSLALKTAAMHNVASSTSTAREGMIKDV